MARHTDGQDVAAVRIALSMFRVIHTFSITSYLNHTQHLFACIFNPQENHQTQGACASLARIQ